MHSINQIYSYFPFYSTRFCVSSVYSQGDVGIIKTTTKETFFKTENIDYETGLCCDRPLITPKRENVGGLVTVEIIHRVVIIGASGNADGEGPGSPFVSCLLQTFYWYHH